MAARSAVWLGDVERASTAAARLAVVPFGGGPSGATRMSVAAGVAALEGRRHDALAGFRDAVARFRSLGEAFEMARAALDAVIVLPDEPEGPGMGGRSPHGLRAAPGGAVPRASRRGPRCGSGVRRTVFRKPAVRHDADVLNARLDQRLDRVRNDQAEPVASGLSVLSQRERRNSTRSRRCGTPPPS